MDIITPIAPLHIKWGLNLNNNTLYILSLLLKFLVKGFFLREYEAYDV